MGMFLSVGAPTWLVIAATVLFLDLVSYGWHRANHRIPFLWRFHRAHHSDLSFTVSTGVRFHPGELLLSLPLRLAAIVVLGAPVVGVLAFEALFTAANLIEHGDIDYPPAFERALAGIFVTPALHRHHHTSRRPDLDTNFATIFSFWDRAFGTYRRSSSAERVQTGAPGVERPLSVAETLALPLAR
jgi:sterol desaturase/sphingolipid hydroxylase (fatty acid hydroxylase superfamily)